MRFLMGTCQQHLIWYTLMIALEYRNMAVFLPRASDFNPLNWKPEIARQGISPFIMGNWWDKTFIGFIVIINSLDIIDSHKGEVKILNNPLIGVLCTAFQKLSTNYEPIFCNQHFLLKIYSLKSFTFIFICMCMHMYAHMTHVCSAHQGQKRESSVVNLELQSDMSPSMWGLGADLKARGGTRSLCQPDHTSSCTLVSLYINKIYIHNLSEWRIIHRHIHHICFINFILGQSNETLLQNFIMLCAHPQSVFHSSLQKSLADLNSLATNKMYSLPFYPQHGHYCSETFPSFYRLKMLCS